MPSSVPIHSRSIGMILLLHHRDFHFRRRRSACRAVVFDVQPTVLRAAAPAAAPRNNRHPILQLIFHLFLPSCCSDCSSSCRADESPQRPLPWPSGFPQIFGLHTRGDKLHSRASHLRQQLLAALVDEGDVAQIHDCARIAAQSAARAPNTHAIRAPRARQLPAQGPSLFCVRSARMRSATWRLDFPHARMHAAAPICRLTPIARCS